MYPSDQQQPQTQLQQVETQQTPTTPIAPSDPAKKKKLLIWGLVCLIGPTALLLITIVLYATMNFVMTSMASESTSPSLLRTIANILMFLVGTVSVSALIPGIIVGIVLLAKR